MDQDILYKKVQACNDSSWQRGYTSNTFLKEIQNNAFCGNIAKSSHEVETSTLNSAK